MIANLSASPYHLGKGESREQMLRTRARDGVAFVAFCNIVGGQDELIFDGRSCVIDPEGEVIARAAIVRGGAARVRHRPVDGDRRAPARRAPAPRAPAAAEAPRAGGVGRRRCRRTGGRASSRASPSRRRCRTTSCGARSGSGSRDYVRKNGFDRVLIGLSGGIDSALVAALAAEALGAEQRRDDLDADALQRLRRRAATRATSPSASASGSASSPIEDLRLAFAGALPEAAGLAAENLQARIRGVLLMTLSNQHGWLVLTTGNKSETATGYSTLYGDTAGGFAPIQDVPKTRVFALARWLNERAGRELIPSSIIERPPSAELRDDQRDDQSLPPYDELDPVLEAYVEDDRSPREIADAGIGDLELARARRAARRPRRVQAPAGASRAEAAPQGVRPRPPRSDHESLPAKWEGITKWGPTANKVTMVESSRRVTIPTPHRRSFAPCRSRAASRARRAGRSTRRSRSSISSCSHASRACDSTRRTRWPRASSGPGAAGTSASSWRPAPIPTLALAALARLRAGAPDIPIVVIVDHAAQAVARATLEHGAHALRPA